MRRPDVIATGLLLFSAFACLILFNFLPVVRNVLLSFMSWSMVVGDPKFVGLSDHKELFTSQDFRNSVIVTVRYALMFAPVIIALGFSLTSLLVRRSTVSMLYGTIFFAPYVTSIVAMSTVLLYIYHPQYRTLGTLLKSLGIEPLQ